MGERRSRDINCVRLITYNIGALLYISKGVPVISHSKILSGIAENLYIFMMRNSLAAHEFYRIPLD